MNWDNTKTKYQSLIKEYPLMAREFEYLIQAVLMDCRNKTNDGFMELESLIKRVGKPDDDTAQEPS